MNKAAKEPTTITTNDNCTLTARSKLFLIHSKKKPTAYEEKYSTIPCTPSSMGHYLRENIKMNVSSR